MNLAWSNSAYLPTSSVPRRNCRSTTTYGVYAISGEAISHPVCARCPMPSGSTAQLGRLAGSCGRAWRADLRHAALAVVRWSASGVGQAGSPPPQDPRDVCRPRIRPRPRPPTARRAEHPLKISRRGQPRGSGLGSIRWVAESTLLIAMASIVYAPVGSSRRHTRWLGSACPLHGARSQTPSILKGLPRGGAPCVRSDSGGLAFGMPGLTVRSMLE